MTCPPNCPWAAVPLQEREGPLNLSTSPCCTAVLPLQVRIGFHGGKDVWTNDVLNIGVSPARLIEKVWGLDFFYHSLLAGSCYQVRMACRLVGAIGRTAWSWQYRARTDMLEPWRGITAELTQLPLIVTA